MFFEEPTITVWKLDCEDVMTTSGLNGDFEGNLGGDGNEPW